MQSFRLSDLARSTAAVRYAATRGPVTITDRNTPRFVLLAVEDFETLTRRAEDPRRAFKVKDLPEDEAALLLAGLGRNILGDVHG